MPIIDRVQLMEHVDGDLEFLQETYEIFCEDSQTMLDELRAACDAGKLESVHSLAHTMRGMLSNFMAESACETAGQLQAIDNLDALSTSSSLLDKLSDQIKTMHSEIQEILVTN